MSADRWVMVPVEPTPEMDAAAFDACEVDGKANGYDNGTHARRGIYRAMIAAAPAAPEPHIDGWPLYSGLPPAAPAAEAVCRSDGRCQYAIDSGAEGLGHCPKGKCIMPAAPGATPAQSREPLKMLTDEQIEALNYIELDRECYEVFSVNKRSVQDFARAVIAEFCKINGIGSQP